MPNSIVVGRQGRKEIRLTPKQRSTHLHVIGNSGMGKSKALEHMIRQDIKAGHGVILIDPHGTLYDKLVSWLALYNWHEHRTIHLVDPSGGQSTVGFNPLWIRDGEEITRRVDRVVEGFARAWKDDGFSDKPRLKKILQAIFYTLAERNLTIAEANFLLSSSNYGGVRSYLTENLDRIAFDRLWHDYNDFNRREFNDHFDSSDSRFFSFITSPTVEAMLGASEHPIDFRRCMDEDEIVLINLRESNHLSAENARVIGTLITNELFSLASSRDEDLAERHPCYFYIDECYDFLSSDIERILTQTRKRGLHLTLVHHYLWQLKNASEATYYGVMAAAQTKMVFGGIEDDDAEVLARQIFRTEFDLEQVQEKLSKPMPTGMFEKRTLESESFGRGEFSAHGTFSGLNTGHVAGEAQAFDAEGDEIGGATQSFSDIESDSAGESEISGESSSHTVGTHDTLVPIYAMMPTSLKSIEQVTHEAIVRLRSLNERYTILKVPGERSLNSKIPFVKDVAIRQKTALSWSEDAKGRSEYTLSTAQALGLIADRHQQLIREAQSVGTDDIEHPPIKRPAALPDEADFLE